MTKTKKAHVYSSDPLDSSIQHVKEYISTKNPLSYEEQLWIFRKDPEKRTDNDALKLIDSNLAMVFKVTSTLYERHKHMSGGFKSSCEVAFVDLFQAGIMGLNRAVIKFDSKREMKFSTYAYHWIEAFIKNEIRSGTHPLKTYSYSNVNIVPLDGYESVAEDKFFDDMNYRDIVETARINLSDLDYRIFNLYFMDGMKIKNIASNVERYYTTVIRHVAKIKLVMQKILVNN